MVRLIKKKPFSQNIIDTCKKTFSFKKSIYFLIILIVIIFVVFTSINLISSQKKHISRFDRVDSYIPFGQESYLQYEKNFNYPLPRNKYGKVIVNKIIARNNQIDAFRHAYVSGVFAIKYGERVARILGNTKELYDDLFYRQSSQEKAMDYWNNAVGRRYGLLTKNRSQLAKILKDAITNKELIVDINDYRCYLVNQ